MKLQVYLLLHRMEMGVQLPAAAALIMTKVSGTQWVGG
jgi:hypothetical protein